MYRVCRRRWSGLDVGDGTSGTDRDVQVREKAGSGANDMRLFIEASLFIRLLCSEHGSWPENG